MYLPSWGLALAWLPLVFASVPQNRSCHEDAAPLLQVRSKQSVFSGDGSEQLLLFLQTNATHCAESLPYSQDASLFSKSSEAGINLGLKDVRHRVWVQELFVGDDPEPAVTLKWKFTRRKTLQERLTTASRVGESVKWTLDPPCPNRRSTKTGVWWFSSNAGLGRFGFNFSGSGSDFSADDGAWGAGFGTVDGTGDMPEDFSGQANRCADRDDMTCGFIFHCGSLVDSRAVGRSRIYMSVPTTEVSLAESEPSLAQLGESPGHWSDCRGKSCVSMAELDTVQRRYRFQSLERAQAQISLGTTVGKRGHRRRRGLGGRRRRGWGRRRRRGLPAVEKAVQESADRVEEAAEDIQDATEEAVQEGIDVVTEDLPDAMEDAVNDVGVTLPELVDTVVDTVVEAAEGAVDVVADAARDGVRQGSKLANEVTRTIVNAVDRLGDLAEAWGVMALGYLEDAWAQIADFLACLEQVFDLTCRLLLSDNCDCDSTPKSDISVSGSNLRVVCVVKGDLLTANFGWEASASASFEPSSRASGGKVQIPGQETNSTHRRRRGVAGRNGFIDASTPSGSLRSQEVSRNSGGTSSRSARTSSSSGGTTEYEDKCEGQTGLALNGEIGIQSIIVEGNVDLLSGETTVDVTVETGLVLEALLEGQGACSFTAARRFPKKPYVKTVCGTYGCLIVMVQGVAEADAFGSLTGAVATKLEATLKSGASFAVDPVSGKVTGSARGADFSRKAGVDVAVSADAVVRFGLGPEVVIWLIPGVPVTINPRVSLEIRAAGTITYSTQTASGSLIQSGGSLESGVSLVTKTNHSRSANDVDACVAVGLNLLATADLSALGIPDQIAVSLDTQFLQDAIEEAIRAVAAAASRLLTSGLSCFSSLAADRVQSVIDEATEVAVDAWDALIPDLNFDWESPSIRFLTQQQCWEVAQSAKGTTDACKQRISCSAEGQSSDPSPSYSVASFEKDQSKVLAPESYETLVYQPDFTVQTDFCGFINYGDRVVLSLNPDIFDSTCGQYGCAVGYVDTLEHGRMKFAEGGDEPDAFYVYGTEQVKPGECVKYGDEVVLSWSEASSEGCVPGSLSHCVESENCEVFSNENMKDESLTFAQRRALCATACFGSLRGLALDFSAEGVCRCSREAELPQDSATSSFCTRPAQSVECIAGQAEAPYIFERSYLTQAACAGACFGAGGYAFDFTLTPRKDSCRCVGKGEALVDAGTFGRRYCTRAQEIFQVFDSGRCESFGWSSVSTATQCARAARFVSWPCRNDCQAIDGGGINPVGCIGNQEDGLQWNFRTTGAPAGDGFSQVCYRTARETFKQFANGSSCVEQGWSIVQDAEQCARAANALGLRCRGKEANTPRCESEPASDPTLPAGCYGDDGFLEFNPYLDSNVSFVGQTSSVGYVCVRVLESEEYDVPRVCADGQLQAGGPFLFQRKMGRTDAAEMSCAAACFASGGVAFDIAFANTRDSCRCVGTAGAQSPSDDPGNGKKRRYCAKPAPSASCGAGEAPNVLAEDLLFETSWTDEKLCAGACYAAASDPSLVAFQVDSEESESSCRCFYHKNQAPVVGHPTRQYCSFPEAQRVSLLQIESENTAATTNLVEQTAQAQEDIPRACSAGQTQPYGPYLFLRELNNEKDCAGACFTAGGVAFDYTLKLKSDSCRCVGLEGAKNPRSNTGGDKRIYCAKPQGSSCRLGEVPESPDTVLFVAKFPTEAACGAFCWAAGGIASQTGRVVFDYTTQVRKDSCRCVMPGQALTRRPGGGRRMLCRFNDVLSPFCGASGCSVGYDGDFMQFNRGSDVSFQPRFFLRAPAGLSKDGTCVYFGDRVAIAASADPAETDCGWYGCKVASVTEEGEMAFQEGGESPTLFYLRPALAESGSYDDPSRDSQL